MLSSLRFPNRCASIVGVLVSQNELPASKKNALASDFLPSIVLAVDSGAL